MDPGEYGLDSPNDTILLFDADETSKITFSTNSNKKNILEKVTITFYSIIFILGIIGNGLVIWIAGFRMKKTISAVWFLHLAIADFLCCLSLPLQIIYWAFINDNSLSFYKYRLLYCILFMLNMSTSVLLLTAMSIDRWVSVMWPFWAKVHRTRKLVRITAGIIWVMSILWTGLGYFLIIFFAGSDAGFHIDLIFRLICLVTMFVIPFLIIVTSYVTICLKIIKSKRPQRSQRPYRIITAVILCFFICFLPFYILQPTPMYDGGFIQLHILNNIGFIMAHINSCINPIIYVFMGQDFRHSFLRSIPFRVEKAISDHPDDPCRG